MNSTRAVAVRIQAVLAPSSDFSAAQASVLQRTVSAASRMPRATRRNPPIKSPFGLGVARRAGHASSSLHDSQAIAVALLAEFRAERNEIGRIGAASGGVPATLTGDKALAPPGNSRRGYATATNP